MLKQQINLYEYIKPANSHVTFLSFKRFIQFQIVFIFLMSCYAIYAYLITFWLFVQNKNEATELQRAENKYLSLSKSMPELSKGTDFKNSIEDIQKELLNKEKILSSMEKYSRWKFSESMLTLSNSINTKTWINQFEFSMKSNDFILIGYSISLPAIHQFIREITHSKTFQNDTLDIKSIEKLPEKNNEEIYKFQIHLMGNA